MDCEICENCGGEGYVRDSLIGGSIDCRQADTDILWEVVVDHVVVVVQAIRKSWRWYSQMAGLGLRELGATGLRVTSIGYGCSPLGNLYGTVKEEEAIASVHEAARLGVNYFDVSPYGHTSISPLQFLKCVATIGYILLHWRVWFWVLHLVSPPLPCQKDLAKGNRKQTRHLRYVVTEVKNCLAGTWLQVQSCGWLVDWLHP